MKAFESIEISKAIYQSTRPNIKEYLNLVLGFQANIPLFWDTPRFDR
jgi:hypothetical protein